MFGIAVPNSAAGIPFLRLSFYLDRAFPATDAGHTTRQYQPQMQIAREIGWAVGRAARYVPFKAVYLPQEMAAKFMLDRRSVASVMHFE